MAVVATSVMTWVIAAAVIVAILLRPRQWPEALWAVLGALVLLAAGLISSSRALYAVRQGTDVYCFLAGMMLLAELARHQGLFDWLAAYAVQHADGSPRRLFLLVYLVGTLVTIVLSNDATAVVLTPAVYAAAKRAEAEPLPYLLICAFIANAASFVLPISNPANLVVFGQQMPSLGAWLLRFAPASLLAIVVTFLMLRWSQRRALSGALSGALARPSAPPALSGGARAAASGIIATAVLLLAASALHWPLGLTTLLAGGCTTGWIGLRQRLRPWPLLGEISWSVLLLVAGLFVLVQAVQDTGVLWPLLRQLQSAGAAAPAATAVHAGLAVALGSNLINNLPTGLAAGVLSTQGHLPAPITDALLVGVDLGPNLSVTGSLATILWLIALRRESQQISAWRFLRLGCLVMPPALLAALVAVVFARL